jgi:hypothetical protein
MDTVCIKLRDGGVHWRYTWAFFGPAEFRAKPEKAESNFLGPSLAQSDIRVCKSGPNPVRSELG